MEIEQEILGFAPAGEAVVLYTLRNRKGAAVRLINVGAALVSVEVPDREGVLTDVVLGFPFYGDYLKDATGLGRVAGRFAGRIARGRFTLEGKEHRLSVNAPPHHYNGGTGGLAFKIWTGRVEDDRVVFSCVSPAGEEGYPGETGFEVAYDWDEDEQLEVSYYAKGDAPTVLAPALRPYFNLDGEGKGSDVLGHRLRLKASRYLPLAPALIPTGERLPVAGTPLDFTELRTIGEGLEADSDQLRLAGDGYDHCWPVDGWKPGDYVRVAELESPGTGIRLDVYTTYPAVCVETGNWLESVPRGKSGTEYRRYGGVSVTGQAFPDAPNHPDFPSAVLGPDELYEQHTLYKFSVAE